MRITLTFLIITLLSANVSYAANSKKASAKEPSKDSRMKMAKVHEKMASCLKSDTPMSECHKEMQNHCRSMMGKDGCLMMGDMGHMMMGGDGCPMMSE